MYQAWPGGTLRGQTQDLILWKVSQGLQHHYVYSFWHSPILLSCTCTAECYCSRAFRPSGNEWLHPQAISLWGRTGTISHCIALNLPSLLFSAQSNWYNARALSQPTRQIYSVLPRKSLMSWRLHSKPGQRWTVMLATGSQMWYSLVCAFWKQSL